MRSSRPWMRYSADWLLVIGTGLMGGSLAAAARKAGVAETVFGLDPLNAAQAKHLGLIDAVLPSLDDAALRRGRGLVVLAAPVLESARLLHEIAARWQSWGEPFVTDLGSTKTALIQAAEVIRAQGPSGPAFLANSLSSHPMAGSEAHGPAAARASLFRGARVLLCPFQETSAACLQAWEHFWLTLGGRTHELPLAEHDPLLAAISHLPHVVSFALGAQLAGSAHAEAAQWLHGGGLRDTTRIAASSPSLWADIFLDNRAALCGLLAGYQDQLSALTAAIASQDRPALLQILEQSARWRERFQDSPLAR